MKKLILLAALVAGMVNFASAQSLYAPGTLALSCNAVTTTGPCASMVLPGNSLAIGVTWQLSYDTGTASGISVTLRGSNDNSTWTVLDTNTACVTTGGAGCSRSLTVTAYKYLDCNVGTFTKGSTNNLSCGITVNPNGGTALGISGTITPGDCTAWFNGTTLEDAGAACGSGSGGNANYTGTLNTVPCGTGTAHTMADCTAGALIGTATGGVQGAGTLNVSGGYYVNGVAVGGSGTVNSGTGGAPAVYLTTGTAVSPGSGETFTSGGVLLNNTWASPYNGGNGIFGKVTTAEGQAVSTDFNFSESQGTQGGACPAGGTGTVTTVGTAVTWVSGTVFPTGTLGVSANWIGQWITINSVNYQIASVATNHALTLATTAGTQSSPVAYSVGLGWSDTHDPVFGLAWNGTAGEGLENTAYGYNWGAWYENNWCSGSGDATNESYLQANIPDGAGGGFQYRPFFVDVAKTANTASHTHVGYTNMGLVADGFTLGSITNLAAHTVTNYLSLSPALYSVASTASQFAGLSTFNQNNVAGGGIQLLSNSGGTAYNVRFVADSQPANCTSNSSTQIIYMGNYSGNPDKWFECPILSTSAPILFGTTVVNSFGLYSSNSLPLATNLLIGGVNGLDVGVNYTNVTNWAGQIMTTNGGGATFYNVAFNEGTAPTAITDVKNCGWSGIICHISDGATDMIAGDGSGNPNLLNTVKFHGSSGLSSSGTLCTATFTTVAGGVTACTAVSDPRLKDISPNPFPYGLKAIQQINPIVYTYNELGRKYNSDDSSVHLGFNAANIQQVMPEAVGTEQHDGVDYLSLPHGTDAIVAALVNAVQEQQKQIEALKAEVQALKAAH
jgi:hypothetical protein